jgi:hypothetical protein
MDMIIYAYIYFNITASTGSASKLLSEAEPVEAGKNSRKQYSI